MTTMRQFSLPALFTALLITFFPAVGVSQDEPKEKKSSPEAIQIFADAASFQNNGAYDLATEEWNKFLKDHSDDPLARKAQHYLGVCLLKQNKFPGAAKAFDAVLKQPGKFELAEDAYLNLGWSSYTVGQGQEGDAKTASLTAASKAFADLAKEFPKGKYADQAYFFQGESLYGLNKLTEAAASYQQVVDNFPDSGLRCDALYALGVTNEELKKYAEAGTIYDIFLKDCAESELVTEVKMRKAETVLQAGNLDAAAAQFAEVATVEGFASADYALFRQGYCLAQQEKFKEAAAAYASLSERFPGSDYNEEATMSVGRCYYRADDFDNAAKWFEKSVKADKFATESAHWLSRIYIRKNEPAKAISLAEATLGKYPKGEYRLNLEMDLADAMYEVPDKREQSLAAYQKLANDNPDAEICPQARYNAAYTGLDLKKYDVAIAESKLFLDAYPDDTLTPDVLYVSGECLLQQKNYAEAEARFNDLVDRFGSHDDAGNWRVRLALTRYLQKKYADVVTQLQTTISSLKSPAQKAEANFLLGASLFAQDKYAEAEKALSASLAAKSDSDQADEALLYLSRAYRKQDKLNEAIATAEKLATQFATSRLITECLFRLGEYNYAAEKFDAAKANYTKSLEKEAGGEFAPFALYGRGWSAVKAKDYQSAETDFVALVEKFPEHSLVPSTYLIRATCRRENGNFEAAIADIDTLLATNPDAKTKADALFEKGLCETKLNKPGAAAETFAAIIKDGNKNEQTPRIYYELAWARKQAGKEADASQAFATLAADYPDSNFAPEANFHVAEQLYADDKFEDAAKKYILARDKASDEALKTKSSYKLAWAEYRQKKFAESAAAFGAVAAMGNKTSLATDSTFMQATSLFELEKFEEAFPLFVKTEAAITGGEKVSDVIQVLTLLRGGQSAVQLEKWQESLDMLTKIPENFSESPYLAEAYYEIGWAQRNLDKPAEAMKSFSEAATRNRGAVGARARFMMGELHFVDKQFDSAVAEYQRVMYGFGGEKAPADVLPWQEKSGYQAARSAEVQIEAAKGAKRTKLIADAKKFYTYVVERFPESEYAKPSQERLEALNKL